MYRRTHTCKHVHIDIHIQCAYYTIGGTVGVPITDIMICKSMVTTPWCQILHHILTMACTQTNKRTLAKHRGFQLHMFLQYSCMTVCVQGYYNRLAIHA